MAVKFVAVVLLVCGVVAVNGDGSPQVTDKPTMTLFRSFPGKERNIDLAVDISRDYKEVGRCLLEDDSGAKISNIEAEERGIKNINDEIFKQWLKGSGKRPVTWETVLDCLEEAKLNDLYSNIKDVLENGVKSERAERAEEHITLPSAGAPMSSSNKGTNKEKNFYVEKEQQLSAYLQEIGDWDSLCTNLGVDKGIMANLQMGTQKNHLKKKECLSAFFDSGRAKWNDVVKVVAAFPFVKRGLACKIAETFMDMDRDYCFDHYLPPKDEL